MRFVDFLLGKINPDTSLANLETNKGDGFKNTTVAKQPNL
jgi:hypothetical protein